MPMPPQGDEQKQNDLGKRGSSSIGGSAGGSINNNQEVQELLSLWAELDWSARRDLLALARMLRA